MEDEKRDEMGTATASAGEVSSAPRFEIKKWNAVTMWSWDICADNCAICRNSLNEPSIEYQVSFPHKYFILWKIFYFCRRIHRQIMKMA